MFFLVRVPTECFLVRVPTVSYLLGRDISQNQFVELPNVQTPIFGMHWQLMKLLRQLKGYAPAAACWRLKHLKSNCQDTR